MLKDLLLNLETTLKACSYKSTAIVFFVGSDRMVVSILIWREQVFAHSES